MMHNEQAGNKTAQRFRDAVLPWLDDAYAFAHVLMRNGIEAEQAVEECYRRAFREFDDFRGTAVRPWLLAILRSVCHERPGRPATPTAAAGNGTTGRRDTPTIRQLVDDLPAPLRETIALREYIDLSYKEVAEVTGAPVTTVMSRIAEARALLLAAKRAANKAALAAPDSRTSGGGSRPTIYRANAC